MLNLILASTGYKCVRTADEDAGDQIQCEVLFRGCHEDMPEGLLYVQFLGSSGLVKNCGLTPRLDGILSVLGKLCYCEN